MDLKSVILEFPDQGAPTYWSCFFFFICGRSLHFLAMLAISLTDLFSFPCIYIYIVYIHIYIELYCKSRVV